MFGITRLDAEQLFWVTDFSIRTEQPFWILFLAYSSFDDCIQAWMCVILSIICWNNYIFQWRDAPFGSYLRRCRRNVWRKIDISMTWKSQNSHPDVMHESSYTPCVKRNFLAPVGFTEIPVGYAKKKKELASLDDCPCADEGSLIAVW